MYEKMTELKVRDYQSPPVTVRESTSVYDCIVRIFVEDVGTIFVVNDQQELEGVSSRKDMLKIAIG